MTSKCQVADLTINRPFKHEVFRQFVSWSNARATAAMEKGSAVDGFIDLRLSVLKPFVPTFVGNAWEAIPTETIIKGWHMAGLKDVFVSNTQRQAVELHTEGRLFPAASEPAGKALAAMGLDMMEDGEEPAFTPVRSDTELEEDDELALTELVSKLRACKAMPKVTVPVDSSVELPVPDTVGQEGGASGSRSRLARSSKGKRTKDAKGKGPQKKGRKRKHVSESEPEEESVSETEEEEYMDTDSDSDTPVDPAFLSEAELFGSTSHEMVGRTVRCPGWLWRKKDRKFYRGVIKSVNANQSKCLVFWEKEQNYCPISMEQAHTFLEPNMQEKYATLLASPPPVVADA